MTQFILNHGRWLAATFLLGWGSLGCSGQYACGAGWCAAGEQYCESTPSNTGLLQVHECVDLPAACEDDPSCDCLLADLGEDTIAECEDAGDAELILTWPEG
jgi:hypothetical protein